MSFDLRVIDCKWHPRAPPSAYFGCTDFNLETHDALQIFASRWGGETDKVYLKTRWSLGDFRVRPYEAVDQYVAVVHRGWAYVPWRFRHERSAQIQNPADVIRKGVVSPIAFRDWTGHIIVLSAENDPTQSKQDIPRYEKLFGRAVHVINMGNMGHTAALFNPGKYVELLEQALDR